jgi:peptidoglycan L-alanyl-D-glutamate endopeptidase CwlK
MVVATAKAADLLSARDHTRLAGVHPDLVAVVEAARQLVPFIVVEGLRTRERQAQLVKSGASRTMDSRHLTGHAVDLAPTVDGEVRWDWPLFYPMSKAMKDAAQARGIALVWGGDWPRFRDGPHFELNRDAYPAGTD